MIGFESKKDAKQAYLMHYNNPKFFDSMKEMSIENFKDQYVKKSLEEQSVGNPSSEESVQQDPSMVIDPMMMIDPYDMNNIQSVQNQLNSIGSVADKELIKLSQVIWGDGYEYKPISKNHVRAEIRGFLQDQLEWLKVNPVVGMLENQNSVLMQYEMPHDSPQSPQYGPGGEDARHLLNEQNLDGQVSPDERL